MMLNRREALQVGLAALTAGVPSLAFPQDEQSLWSFPGFVPRQTDDGLLVPVKIILPPGRMREVTSRIIGRVVDRPLFGFPPRQCIVLRINWSRTLNGGWEVSGLVEVLMPYIDSIARINGIDRCDDVTFIPFGRA